MNTLEKINDFSKIISDSQSDYKVRQEAEKAYDIFRKILPRIKNPAIIEKGGNGPGPLWYLRYDKPQRYMTKDNFMLDYSLVNYGSPYKNLLIVLSLTDDNDNSHNNRRGIFLEKYSGNQSALFFYLFNSGVRDEDKFDPDEVLSRIKYDQNIKSTFIHEFTHFHDYLRSKDITTKKARARYYQPEENYEKYINHPLEYNARYMQSIHSILNSFARVVRVKEQGIKGRFPTFKEFLDFYWYEPGYIMPSFKKNLDSKNKEKLIRRLYKFYDYITKDEDFTKEQALQFAERQKELDAMQK